MNLTKIIEVDNGGRRYWMVEGVPHLFESKAFAMNYAQLYPKETGPWKEAQDLIERENYDK